MDKNKLWISKDDMKSMTIKPREYEIIDAKRNIISTPYHYNNIRIAFDDIARRFFSMEDDSWVDLPRKFYHECYNKLVLEKEAVIANMDFMKIDMSQYHRDSDILETKAKLLGSINEKYMKDYKEQMDEIFLKKYKK